MELYADKVPKTAINFRALCTGEKGEGSKNTLHYKNTFIHKIEPGFAIFGGDTEHKYGRGGESIYGVDFDNESFFFKHDTEGLLT
jgi:cyclophilin family peptidyl-prolyl cis-trans isomerase